MGNRSQGRCELSRRIKTPYGEFTPDGWAFQIHDPRLPGVWEHYLSNDSYCLVLSQTWCGYSFYRSRPLYPVSVSGRFAYLREEETGEVWPLNEPAPCLGQLPSYEDLHGFTGDQTAGTAHFRSPLHVPPLRRPTDHLTVRWEPGAASLTSERAGLRAEMTLRVAPQAPLEIWSIRLENRSRSTRRLSLLPVVGFHLGAGVRMFGNAAAVTFTDIDRRRRAIFARMEGLRAANLRRLVGFLAAAEGSPSGYFGTLAAAQAALLDSEAPEAHAAGEEAVACLALPLRLAPEASARRTLLVGVAESYSEARRLVQRYRSAGARAHAATAESGFWRRVRERQVIETPDPRLDRFYNLWLKYELYQTARWTRGDGRGYRDVLQDAEGMALLSPEYALFLLRMALRRQRRDGWAVRSFDEVLPPAAGDSRDFRDSAVWLVFTLEALLRETGARGLLGERIGFRDGGSGTVFEHAFAACAFLMAHRGRHGLPLVGDGDWNDALDGMGAAGRGESVWLAMALHRALVLLRELARRTRRWQAAERLGRWRAQLERAIQGPGWDGEWYARGYDDLGRRVGGRACRQGRIFLLPQAWAAFSGLSDPERIRTALEAADRYLDSPWGPPILWPAYTARDERLGRITVRAPGVGENGGVHTHAAMFKVKADLALGRGTRAYQTLVKLAPLAGHPESAVPLEPPYVLCNQRLGPEHPRAGAHKNRWLSGAVAWMFRLVTEDLLGARAEHDGLRVCPCLPADWEACRMARTFRGAVYDLHLRKPKGLERGRVRLVLDGRRIEGALLPVFADGRRHKVICELEEDGFDSPNIGRNRRANRRRPAER